MTTETTSKVINETSSIESENTTETVETVAVETFPDENTNVENMIYTLPMMGKGMLGIFIVTTIIIAGVVILNKVTGKNK